MKYADVRKQEFLLGGSRDEKVFIDNYKLANINAFYFNECFCCR